MLGLYNPISHPYRPTFSHILLLILIHRIVSTLLGRLGFLSLHASRPSTAKRRRKSKINVLLGIETHNKGGDIDDLLADTT